MTTPDGLRSVAGVVLGADPAQLDALAAAFRAAARRLADPVTVLQVPGWSGPDAEALARRLRQRVDAPRRDVARSLLLSAARLEAAGRQQRRASAAPPPAAVVVRDAGDRGLLVQRVGRPDAPLVVVLVPGVGTDPGDAPRLRRDARRVWTAVAEVTDEPGDVAVVSWLGYDPPDLAVGGLDPRPAAHGARALVTEVDQLRAAGARRVTVVGHSYGGVVAGRATELGLRADAVVLLGAPGAGTRDLGQEPFGGVRVWAARADCDPIRWAQPLASLVHGPDPLRLHPRLATSRPGHGAYLRDPLLLEHLAAVVVGRGVAGPGEGPVRSDTGGSTIGGGRWGSR